MHRANDRPVPGSPGSFKAGLALCGFSALLLAPNAVAWFYELYEPGTLAWQRLSYALALWICFLALIGNLRLACLLVAPFLLIVPVEIHLLVRYQSPLLPHVLGIVRETNPNEAFEYMRGLWVAALIAYGGLGIAAFACLRILWRAAPRWRHWLRYGLPLLLFAIGAGFHIRYESQEDEYGLTTRGDEFRMRPPPFMIERLRETSPFGIPLRVHAYLESASSLERAHARLEGWRFGAAQTPGVPVPQTFVLVLGESARADRWQINGYARATSPRLSAARNLVSFSDMVTLATTSRQSIPAIIARKSAQMVAGDLPLRERSLIAAFREAGFRTYWFSTQAPTGYHDSPVTVHAREAEVLRFLNFSSYSYRTPFDGVLLPELERTLAEPHARQLIVLHTLGSHFNYSFRYPPEFEAFRPAMGAATGGALDDPGAGELLNNAYDNTILYTDHILSEVIRILDASGRPVTAMLYVSDHGEHLFDEGCPRAGHMMDTHRNFQVPAFFWYSRGYADAFPAKVARLQGNKDTRLTTQNVFATLLDSAEIRFAGETLASSVLSSRFTEQPRIVAGQRGTFDYDKARPDGCRIY